MRNKSMLALALLPLWVCPALAHVMLVERTAKPGSEFLASFRVGHGCDHAPTTALTVTLPAGVTGAKPQAKPGWTIEQRHDAGKAATITWRDGSLPADRAGDFRIVLRLPDTPATLAFPVTQACAAIVENWSELPAPGKTLTHPAPLLTVTQGAAPADDMSGMAMP